MPQLLLIPGLNCTDRLFHAQIETFAGSHAVHLARHGRHATMAADAAAILAEAPERFALCGLSMGGYLAIEIVRQAPERVERLALLDTRAAPDTAEMAAGRRALIALAESGRFPEIHGLLWPRLVRPAAQHDTALEATVLAMMQETGPERFIRQEQAILSRPDYRPALATIHVPTLVLVGAEDALTPPAMAREIAAGVAGSNLVEVPDCGHLSTLEQPAAVNAALRSWLGTTG